MSDHLLSYIAHMKHTPKEVVEFQIEMTNRSFPCLRSNQVEENYTDPKELSSSRLSALDSTLNRFFFFFIEQSQDDAIALVELGFALNKTEHVCVIGRHRSNSFMFHPRVKFYDSIDNFLFRHTFK